MPGTQRDARVAQRYRISHDVSHAEAIKQMGKTTVRADGAYCHDFGPLSLFGRSCTPGFHSPITLHVFIPLFPLVSLCEIVLCYFV
jgi:hypothetical protein